MREKEVVEMEVFSRKRKKTLRGWKARRSREKKLRMLIITQNRQGKGQGWQPPRPGRKWLKRKGPLNKVE